MMEVLRSAFSDLILGADLLMVAVKNGEDLVTEAILSRGDSVEEFFLGEGEVVKRLESSVSKTPHGLYVHEASEVLVVEREDSGVLG